MTLRQFVAIMIFATILCWVSFGMVMVNIDPFEANIVGVAFFYLSFFLSLLGTSSLISFFLYQFFSREALPMSRYVKKSFRHGMFFSVLSVIGLFLQIGEYINMWSATLFLLVVALLISFSVTTKHPV